MPIEIKSVKGYYNLDVWVMANVIQIATFSFCRRFLNKGNDPRGRQFDQMTQAARSVTANIAEGLSLHQTSREMEMKLADVARASLSELLGDYLFLSIVNNIEPWAKGSEAYAAIDAVALDRPQYTDDLEHEAWQHIKRQSLKFDTWTNHERMEVCLNAMIGLCNRETDMLQTLIASLLDDFRQHGGFTENLTEERLAAIRKQAAAAGNPSCPVCGKPMRRRMIRKGAHSGEEFWGCTDYPNCCGTRTIGQESGNQQ